MIIRLTYRSKTIHATFKHFALDGNVAVVHVSNLVGDREVNFNHGFGMGRFKDWHVVPEDLEALRALAKEHGKTVTPCGRSTGRPPAPRGPQPVHPKQLSFFDYLTASED